MSFKIDNHIQGLVKLRHKLHSLAELSGEEEQTAQVVKGFLQNTGPESLKTDLGGHGLLAAYDSTKKGPHILLRCELDALPIEGNKSLDYQSKTEGVGHQCGHDGHISILCGVALFLKDQLKRGKVSLLFQPSEENGKGARRILEASQFDKSSYDYCFALHNLPGFKKQQIVLKDEVFAAASVGLEIQLKGKSSHAAHPEEGKSPAMAVANIIEAYSAIPQFFTRLGEQAKVTVISATLGTQAFGTSPGRAAISTTLRADNDRLLERLKGRCLKLGNKSAGMYDLQIKHQWLEPFAATVNDPGAAKIVDSAAKKLDLKTIRPANCFSWSEDFGRFTKEIPGALFGLGIGKDHPALHSNEYDFQDEVIPTGVSMFIKIIKELQQNK